MASTTQKKKSGGSKSRSTSKTAPATPRKSSRASARPVRREVGALVCLFLAFLAAIGYFNLEGFLINLFRNFLCGLMGYGFWFAPLALLLSAYILYFHRGRPVKLPLWCALLAPAVLGAVFHLFLAQADSPFGLDMFPKLWTSGLALQSGGVVSGLLAELFIAAFSKIGAAVVLIAACAVMVLASLRLSPIDLVDELHRRIEERPDYELEEEPVRPRRTDSRERRPREREQLPASPERRRRAVDIPVDDGPPADRRPTEPVTTVRRKNLFDKVPSVPTPDKVLTGEPHTPVEEEPPEYEDVPVLSPVPESEPPAPRRRPPVPAEPEPFEEEPEPEPEEEDVPELPPIVREPAVERPPKREEAPSPAQQVEKEIESSLTQEDPPAYRYPPISLLDENRGGPAGSADAELRANQQRLQNALQSFGVSARIVNVIQGPSIVRYELELDQGVKLSKLTNLADDIALALGASGVRVAPIPNKISTVGIEVPKPRHLVNPVVIRDVLGSQTFEDSQSKVSFAVGKDISGRPVVGNIAKLPHLLIAGTTGAGKSVCTNSLAVSLLYKASPEEVRLIIIDPKVVEFKIYNGIPHLLIPVVTDPKKAAGALQWSVSEMEKRYQIISEVGARNLETYNTIARERDDLKPMPRIVIIIDELADLMMAASKEVEDSIVRVAQKGRASGLHLVIATQSPRADVITGLMKANIPSRIALRVASGMESRIILDTMGAEKLGGPGDMLFAPVGEGQQRIQGCFISDEEIAGVLKFLKEGAVAQYDESVMHEVEKNAADKDKGNKTGGDAPSDNGSDYDELLPQAIDVVLEMGQASVSMLQRRLKLGYGRAARLVDQMEEKGVVGPFEGAKPRQLLITKEQWQEMQFLQNMAGSLPPTEAVPPALPDDEDEDEPPFEE